MSAVDLVFLLQQHWNPRRRGTRGRCPGMTRQPDPASSKSNFKPVSFSRPVQRRSVLGCRGTRAVAALLSAGRRSPRSAKTPVGIDPSIATLDQRAAQNSSNSRCPPDRDPFKQPVSVSARMDAQRPSTPPGQPEASSSGALPRGPLTPEQQRRIEVNRMKAKAIREQREAEEAQKAAAAARSTATGQPVAGVKRSFVAMTASDTPASSRDGRAHNATATDRPLDAIRPARNFAKYVDYDFSKMTDTKGGFLTQEDDPHNKALHGWDDKAEQKPPHMTEKEWEKQQLLKSLRRDRAGPFEPGLSVLDDPSTRKTCRECGSLEIDWKWEETFKCCVCSGCKQKYPEKYSLLTKTEVKEDYLLTDAELRDEELLPRMERPNPHKATWNNMMLFLRYQVEEYAFSPKKWGSPEALDAEFERRESEKKRRREAKFRSKLEDLKKRTMVEAYRRNRKGPAGGNFGDDLGGGGRHVHQWGRAVEDPETGMGVKKCVECGMEVEELEF